MKRRDLLKFLGLAPIAAAVVAALPARAKGHSFAHAGVAEMRKAYLGAAQGATPDWIWVSNDDLREFYYERRHEKPARTISDRELGLLREDLARS